MNRVLIVAFALAIACNKSDASRAGPAASASASVSPVIASASPSASSSAAIGGASSFAGTYTATIGVLYVPDAAAWDGVKFRGDYGDAGALGDGKLSLTLDSGAVTGELEGPLGPATISGVTSEKSVTFNVAPKTPGDFAFSGTGTATIDGDKISGEIHVSSWRANILRDATFAAKKK